MTSEATKARYASFAGQIEARGARPQERRGAGGPARKAGKFMIGKRGRPGNIRHQGRKK